MDFSNKVSEELDELTFVVARHAMKEEGRFDFVFTNVVYNDEKEVITLIDSFILFSSSPDNINVPLSIPSGLS